jgi:hypothetical protein
VVLRRRIGLAAGAASGRCGHAQGVEYTTLYTLEVI